MAGQLDGKVAIVTGGNSGIGEASAHRFAGEGAKVALMARREPQGIAVQDAIRAEGGEATFIQCDVGERASGWSRLPLGTVPPVGFDGKFIIKRRVFEFIKDNTSSASKP